MAPLIRALFCVLGFAPLGPLIRPSSTRDAPFDERGFRHTAEKDWDKKLINHPFSFFDVSFSFALPLFSPPSKLDTFSFAAIFCCKPVFFNRIPCHVSSMGNKYRNL